ncbi:MAG: LamG domain-containing protein, partial [Lentisphaeria bacterium]
MKKVFAGLIFALGVLVAKANISSGLCYHLTFDNSLKPEFAKGTYVQEYPDNLIFKPGKVGSALELSQNKALSLGNYLGNLNPARGTVAFWFNPKQTPREQVNTIQLWRCGGLSLTMTHRNKKIYFMSASNQAPDGWVWDYSTHSHLPYTLWKADNWYHIAISWDATTKNKRLYIDGKQISKKNTQHIKNYNGSDTEILLGGNNSNGLFDELAIWQ